MYIMWGMSRVIEDNASASLVSIKINFLLLCLVKIHSPYTLRVSQIWVVLLPQVFVLLPGRDRKKLLTDFNVSLSGLRSLSPLCGSNWHLLLMSQTPRLHLPANQSESFRSKCLCQKHFAEALALFILTQDRSNRRREKLLLEMKNDM